MAWKKPWWARIEGGREAIQSMASFGASATIRRAQLVRQLMPTNRDTPVGTAVIASGVDPATARRLDVAVTASNAGKAEAIYNDAGIPETMRDPRRSGAVNAFFAAQEEKRKKEDAERSGFGRWWNDLINPPAMRNMADAVQTGDPEIARAAVEATGGTVYRNGEKPFGQGVADWVGDAGKSVLDVVGTVGNAIISPVKAPIAAGSANPRDPDQIATTAALSRGGWIGQLAAGAVNSFANFAKGIEQIVDGTNVSEAQKQDMRRAGYDPDSWSDRYGWYADIHDENSPQSDSHVARLKAEGANKYKVDLVREVLTSGVDEDPSRFRGLSEDAQRLVADVQANKDPEAARIFQTLAKPTLSLGANVAEGFGLKPEDKTYVAASIIGDLAAYWFIDPLVVGGKALNAYRVANYGVKLHDASEIKDAIALGGTRLAKRWDSALDSVDKMYVLSRSKDAESQAQLGAEFTRFQRVHNDMMPFLSILTQMRAGSVQGVWLKAPSKNAKMNALADFRAETLGLRVVDNPDDFKPIFQLRSTPNSPVTQSARDAARAAMAERLSDVIIQHHIMQGRPLVGDKQLMPGQFRFSTPIRIGLGHTMDVLLGQKGKLLKQLKDAEGKGLVDFATIGKGTTAHVIDTAKGGDWIRQNYTKGSIRDRMAMTISRFGVFHDAPVIRFDDAGSTADIFNFAKFFMPRGQASYLAAQWAQAAPATRSVMLDNLVESLANARLAKDGRAATDFWRQAFKGRERVTDPGMPVAEAYSRPDLDLIQTEVGDVAAAMYSTQFAEGVRLPSLVDILVNTEKIGVFSALAGISHSRWVTAFTRVVKSGQVATTSNLLRQAGEGRTLQWLDDPAGAVRVLVARMGLAGGNASDRVIANTIARQARQIQKSGEMDRITPLRTTKRFDDYADEAIAVLLRAGVTPEPMLRDLLEAGALIPDLAKSRSAARLAATRLAVDPARKARTALYKGVTKRAKDEFVYPWLAVVGDRAAKRLEDSAHRMIGGQTVRYADASRAGDLDQIEEGIRHGQRLATLHLRNTHGYLGAAGDVGAQRWGNALGLRLADPVGEIALEAVAREALHELKVRSLINKAYTQISSRLAARGITPNPSHFAGVDTAIRTRNPMHASLVSTLDRKVAQRGSTNPAVQAAIASGAPPAVVEGIIDTAVRQPLIREITGGTSGLTAKNITAWLLEKDELGAKHRQHGRRGQYLAGKHVASGVDKDAAMRAWAEQMSEDAAHYLGMTAPAVTTRGVVDADHVRLLKRVANRRPIDTKDLARVHKDFRPEEVHSPIVIGKKFSENFQNGLVVDGASKMYQFVVANPLQRLVHDPQTVAAHHEAMASLEPVARAMHAKGMSAESIYDTLDTLAYGHAVNRVARYSDNPNVTSYFAALSNNFLWYERAMEDFARRALRIARADPAVVARAHLMWESASHSGMVTESRVVDEDGNAKTQYVFAWPGSGLAMRVINETAVGLGLVDDDVVQVPVWQDLTSPVQWLSPSLQNPVGFTTTPLIGAPARLWRTVFPEDTMTVDTLLSTFEGGERFFGSQDLLSSVTPTYLKRIINAMDPDDRDSMAASATRNAMIYLSAAGKLPPPDASDVDHQRAQDDLRQMVQNNLIFRTLFASVLPATPSSMNSNVSGIGDEDLNVIDRERGINTIRGEWFMLLEDMAKRYPGDSDRAYSEASAEWMRRERGSIVNPAAFLVGSSGAPGTETGKAFGSSEALTQWMLDHKDFLEKGGQAAYSLLPEIAGPYYDQVGYQVQLRTGLRQHKNSEEFYKNLVVNQANSAFYSALSKRNELVMNAKSDKEKNSAKAWFNDYTDRLKRANPVWASDVNERKDIDYIASKIAPSVIEMAKSEDLPPELRDLQPRLQTMARLYEEYRNQLGKYPGSSFKDKNGRLSVTSTYNRRGDELFLNGPLHTLWKSMKAWEE